MSGGVDGFIDGGSSTGGTAAPSPTPGVASTTEDAIRALMISAVQSLTPSVLSETRFVVHREESNFQDWCAKSSTAAFRRFSIRETGENDFPEITNTTEEWRIVVFDVLVAYPDTSRYGDDNGRNQDDVMRADLVQIDGVIGLRGHATFDNTAAWLRDLASPPAIVRSGSISFQRFRNAYRFSRSYP